MYEDRIIANESGGDPNARNPRSTATGAGQFLESTWLEMIQQHRPDLAQGRSRDEILALRTDGALSREMTARYAVGNAQRLQQAGFEPNPGNTYLAHFAGPGGAVSVLSANPATPVGQILGPRVIQSNPFLMGMTAGDLVAWSNRRMGAPSGAPMPAPSPAPSPIPAGQPPAYPPGPTPEPVPQRQQPAQPQQPMDPSALAPPQAIPPMFPQIRSRLALQSPWAPRRRA